MRKPGTGGCFKSLHQEAGIHVVMNEMSFAELMTDSADAVLGRRKP